jgi:hypothetical protein
VAIKAATNPRKNKTPKAAPIETLALFCKEKQNSNFNYFYNLN